LGVLLLLAALAMRAQPVAGDPYEDAFIRLWGLHRQAPDDHAAVAAACREALGRSASDKTPLAGRYQPVVRTLEGWRLLQAGLTDEAATSFEAALSRGRTFADPLSAAADALARRWLSRIDRERVVAALQAYHREHVGFPAGLDVFQSWPIERRPPLLDRIGDPWSYQLLGFRRLNAGGDQRYRLYSRSIGRATSSLEAARALRPPETPIFFVRKTAESPVVAEFRIGGATNRPVVLQEGTRGSGVIVAAIDGQGRFALLSDDDFWLLALPPGGGRR
jgi:hypothetical protein